MAKRILTLQNGFFSDLFRPKPQRKPKTPTPQIGKSTVSSDVIFDVDKKRLYDIWVTAVDPPKRVLVAAPTEGRAAAIVAKKFNVLEPFQYERNIKDVTPELQVVYEDEHGTVLFGDVIRETKTNYVHRLYGVDYDSNRDKRRKFTGKRYEVGDIVTVKKSIPQVFKKYITGARL